MPRPYIGEPYTESYFHTFSQIRPEGYHDYSRFLDFAQGQNLWENIADDIEATTGLVSGKDVLHVCCEYGYLTNILTTRGANVIGVDLSTWAISQAQSLFPALTFVEADFVSAGFGLNQFDLLVVVGWVERMPTDPDIADLMQECGRVTHPTGTMYFLIDYDETDPIYQNKTASEWLAILEAGIPGPYDFAVEDVGHLPLYYRSRVVVT